MKTKKTNITITLCTISNMLVQISRNINDNVYNHDDMLEKMYKEQKIERNKRLVSL